MRVNYTHQRSCGKCQTASYRIEINVGVPLQGARIFAVSCRAMGKKDKRKKRCNKYFRLTFFLRRRLVKFHFFFSIGCSSLFLFIYIFRSTVRVESLWNIKTGETVGIIAQAEQLFRERQTNYFDGLLRVAFNELFGRISVENLATNPPHPHTANYDFHQHGIRRCNGLRMLMADYLKFSFSHSVAFWLLF